MYVGTKFSLSVTVSIEAKEVVVNKVDQDVFHMLKTEKEETDRIAKLNHWLKKVLKQAEDKYLKFSRTARYNLATSHGILLSLLDDGLKN